MPRFTRRNFLAGMLATTALAACAAPTSSSAPTTAPAGGASAATSAPATPAVSSAASTATPAAKVAASKGGIEILNVSNDPTRELYQAFNAAFAKDWKDK